jgi:hypothetical protein
MRAKSAVLTLSLLLSHFAIAQPAPQEITNADVTSMVKAGIGDQTIILAIQHGPVKFDTSPQALITLKGAGVSDQVLNAILASANGKGNAMPEAQGAAPKALFQKALDAIGPHDKIAAIHSMRWKGSVVQTLQGGSKPAERETFTVFPDRVSTTVRGATGQVSKQVITPDFNYRTSGTNTVMVPPADLESVREQFWFDPINIAQHLEDYTVSAPADTPSGDVPPDRIQISKYGKSIVWVIDPQTGRLLSTRETTATGEKKIDYSDWRSVDGVYFPFKRHLTDSSGTTEFTATDVEVNPTIDEHLFQPPSQAPTQGLTLRVLQEQSVPYIQQSGGGISTSCSIVGSANTSGYANTLGNSTYGNATTSSSQHMNCNSYDTTMRWPHVLNVMFAEGSDGNSYMFACDRAWRWSKCVPLRVGQEFNARFTSKGFEIDAFNTKGKEENPTYQILQSKSSR